MKKIIVITGASSGLGFSLANLLAKENTVIATYRDLEKGKKLFDHANIIPVKVDISKDEDQTALLQRIDTEFGHIDYLINNAACNYSGFFEELQENEIRLIMEINFFASISLIKKALPLLRKAHRANIVNIGSTGIYQPLPMRSIYQASKGALWAFSRSLSLELIPDNIGVILIEPGPFKSPLVTHPPLSNACLDVKNSHYPYAAYFLSLQKQIIDQLPITCDKVAHKIHKILKKKKNKLQYRILDPKSLLLYYLSIFLPFSFYQKIFKYVLFKSKN